MFEPLGPAPLSVRVLKSVALEALARAEAGLQDARRRLDAVPPQHRSHPEYRRQEAELDRLMLAQRDALSRIDTCPSTFIDLVEALEQATPQQR